MNPSTDKDLVAAALAGDVGAWEGIVRRHYGLVFGIGLAWLGEVEAAEDLAQEVFLRLFVRLKDLRDGDRFAPWAARTARNLAVNWLRDRQTRSRLIPMIAAEEATMAEVPDSRPTARDQAEREEQQRLVRGMIATLPEEERELVVLHFMEGCSQRELARKLGVNVSTISRRLDASLKRLREQFDSAAAETLRCDEGARGRAAARAGALAAGYMALPEMAKAAVLVEASKVAVPVGVAATTASLYTGVALMSAKSVAISAAIAVAVVVMLAVGGVVVVTNQSDSADKASGSTAHALVERDATVRETAQANAEPAPDAGSASVDSAPRDPAIDHAATTSGDATNGEPTAENYDGITLVVRGRVLNDRRQPIGGAEVRLSKLSMRALTGYAGAGHPVVTEEQVDATTISEANGMYELRSNGVFPLQLAAIAAGHRIVFEGIGEEHPKLRPLTSETRLIEHDFALPSAPALQGIVVDGDDEPVEGASVKAVYVSGATWNFRPQLELATETDPRGAFLFEGIGNHHVRLEAQKEGVGQVRHVVDAEDTGDIVIRLVGEGQTVSGIVTDWEGEPVSGVTVSLGNAMPPNMSNPDPIWFEMVSDDDGAFAFESVPVDSYYVAAQAPDGRRSLSRDNRSYEPVNIVEGRDAKGITLRLFDGYEVSGTVRDGMTGEPIAGAEVRAVSMMEESQQSAMTNEEGRYVLTGVQGNPDFGRGMTLTLMASKEGYRFASGPRFQTMPQLLPEPGQREYTLDLDLFATVEWSGRVLTPDGSPAVGARVSSVGEPSGEAMTDRRGEFTLQVAVNRRAQILASLSGYPPTHSEPVDIETQAPSDVVIRLDPGATAVLRVEDQEGKAIPEANAGLMIRTYGATWSSASRSDMKTTGVDGRAVFEHLPTEGHPISILHNRQSIDFFARMKGYGTPKDTLGVIFRPGERREVVITMPSLDESGVLAGVVTDPDGRPLANVQVNLNRAPDFLRTTTGSDGRFRKDKLPAGTYNLTFYHVEFGYANEPGVETGTEDLEIVIGKDRAILTIVVVDGETGETITNSRVRHEVDPPDMGITNIPGAHRFPNYSRNRRMSFVVTAPGYEDLTIAATNIPEREREFIMTAEMTRLAE